MEPHQSYDRVRTKQNIAAETQKWYRHEPLPSTLSKPIRLLRILPGSTKSICCEIQTYETDQEPAVEYLCLSYQWGSEEQQDSMRIIALNSRQFRVRKNLWDFLYTARFKCNSSGSGYAAAQWWIDAICIDQTNLVEKGLQVRLMGEIYMRAKCVIQWLGKGDASLSSSPHVLRLQSFFINERYAQFADLTKRVSDEVTGSYSRYWKPTRFELALLIHATSSEYWTRAWVVQEISLAQKILVWQGDIQVQFDFLGHLYETALEACKVLATDDSLHGNTRLLRNWPMALLLRSRARRAPRTQQHFANLLRAYRHLQCAEPRDRVYSLLSLTKAGQDIRPDYEIDPLAVFFNILWACRDEFCICLSVVLMDVLQLGENIEQHKLAFVHSMGHVTSLMPEPYIEITSELAHPTDAKECDQLLDIMRLTDVFTCSCRRVRIQLGAWLQESREPIKVLLYCFEQVLGMQTPLHIVFASYGEKIIPYGIYEGQWHDAQWREVHPQEIPCELSLAHLITERQETRQLTLRISPTTLLHLAKRISEQPTYRLSAISFGCAHYASHKLLYDLRPHDLNGDSSTSVPLAASTDHSDINSSLSLIE